MAEAASKTNARLVHLSTDFVFDGEKASAYVESDQTNPIGFYGQFKLAGELNTRAALPSTCIARTSWVYSQYGKNFLRTMLRLSKDRPTISVVNDQWGKTTGLGETFHLAGGKKTKWSDFARLMFELDSANGEPASVINDMAAHEYPTLAARPKTP